MAHSSHVRECCFRGWDEYENGFGELDGNVWLGLTYLHRLTADGPARLHVYLETFDEGDWAYAAYASVQVSDSSDNYRLTVEGYSGTAGDAMIMFGAPTAANEMQFSTYDRDNDLYPTSCAQTYRGGWWYNQCHVANVNGLYLMASTGYLTEDTITHFKR